VLAKEDGEWRLTACQNIGVPDDELETSGDSRPIFGTGK
jgi:hypothetical protein